MKKVLRLSMLILLLMFVSYGFSQNEKDKQQVIERTNVKELLKISKASAEKQKLNREKALEVARQKGWTIRKETENSLFELQGISDDGRPLYYITTNYDAAVSVSTDEVWSGGSAGLDLDGTGMIAGEWDGGDVLTTHQEFNNTGSARVIDMDGTSSTHYHATHVAGTIVAGGVQSDAKGMAHNGTLHAYDWNSDESEMASAAANGLLISNHSYGYIAGWYWNGSSWEWVGNESISTEEDYAFGFYGSSCVEMDNIALNAPYYLIVKSAGNDRGDGAGEPGHPQDGGADGYDCIGYKGNSKNILTVGAVQDVPGGYSGDPGDVLMTSFSSWGPTDDGRIKPDICGNGYYLYSTYDDHNTAYNSISGTSMSSPNVTGSLLLLQEHYNETHGSYMKAATLKALAIHTADECGPNDGPDYMFGWGLLNTKNAASVISNKEVSTFINEESLSNGATYTLDITATGTEPLVVTVVWADPAGTPVSPQLDPTDIMLVNDLDVVVDDGTTNYYPYKLNGQNPSAAATTGDNDIDNVEKVYIASPSAGTYTITINHEGTISGGSQDFSLIVSGISNGYAVVSTGDVTNITTNSADVSGEVIDDNGATVTERGFVYNTSGNPTVDDFKVIVGSGEGLFNATLTGLNIATKYYVRAYAINADGVAYGNLKDFTTLCSVINTFPYVQNFESGEIPACWQNEYGAATYGWEFGTDGSSQYWSIPAHTTYAYVNDDACNCDMSDVWLKTSAFDFSIYSSLELTFESFADDTYGGAFTIKYSTNGGSTWSDLVSVPSSDTWVNQTVDLSSFDGNSSVMLAFHYSDANAWASGWAIDDITIDGVSETTYAVTFNVEDNSNNPVEAANIYINNQYLQTDATGVASIELVDGTYEYTVSKSGYVEVTGSTIVNGGAATVNVTLEEIPLYVVSFNVADENSQPIEGAVINIYGNVLTTDASGFASVELENGSYDYSVTADGYGQQTGSLVVADGPVSETVTMSLVTYILTFAIEDENGQAVSGASININSTVLTTDSYGLATIELVPETYPYSVNMSGYDEFTGSVVVVDQDITEEVVLVETVYSVMFIVVDEVDDPIDGAVINIAGNTLTTNYSGEASIELPAGTYSYDIVASGFESTTGSVTVDNGNVEAYVSLNTAYYILTFEVTSSSGSAIEGASIEVGGQTLTTNSYGIATVEAANGTYNYTVSAEDYNDISDNVTVYNSNVTEEVVLQPVLYIVTFVVSDEYSNPIQNATVTVNSTTISTNAEGEATIELANGTYDYTISAEGYNDASGNVTVSDSDVSEEVVLEPMLYLVTFVVSDDNSNPIQNATITINSTTLSTNSSGEATIELTNATYDYMVEADGYNDISGNVTVYNSNVTEEVVLQPVLYIVTFVVSDEYSNPIQNATITVNSATISTDAGGEASVELANGTYDYMVEADGFGDISGQVVVDNDATTVNIVLTGVSSADLIGFKLFPNPNNGMFTVTLDGEASITILDAVGKVIAQQEVNQSKDFNIDGIAKGVYFIRVESNKVQFTKRMIVE